MAKQKKSPAVGGPKKKKKGGIGGKAWKSFMAKLYGWGAAIVIVGALFKIEHWEGASEMLSIGLGTEALIFFMSAFEPLARGDLESLAVAEVGNHRLNTALVRDAKESDLSCARLQRTEQ